VRTITSFPHHQVLRHPDRAVRFVRDSGRVAFEEFWRAYPSRSPHTNSRKAARLKFDAAVKRGVDPADILRGAANYAAYAAANVRDSKYVMQATTWLNQEQWVHYGRRQPPAPAMDDLLSSTLNGSQVMRDAFESDILVRARRLALGSASESDLAATLMGLYVEMRAERSRAYPAVTTSGPMDLLRRYVIWLGERDWPTMTVRVLSKDSPAFQQFRREEAALHPRGADPLTGR
jgi:hypothetical protein